MNLSVSPLKNIAFGNDAWKLKPSALKAKGLGTLAKEQDTFERMNKKPEPTSDFAKAESMAVLPNGWRSTPNAQLKSLVKKYVADGDYDSILKLAGIQVYKTKDGKKAISCYKQPSDSYGFKYLGVDEKELLKDVVSIMGDASFNGSSLESTGQIRNIYGDLTLSNSKIKDASSLKHVSGFAFLPKGISAQDIKLDPSAIKCTVMSIFN